MSDARTIDGDISDFIDAQELSAVFSIDELLAYLRREGHAEWDILSAVRRWQVDRFAAGDGGNWERFTLTEAGTAAVHQLRREPI